MENELGLTALFNQYLAGPGNALRHLIGLSGPTERPWDNSVVMEILVVALLVVTVAILRSQLSVDKPGKLQHIFEMLQEFFTTTVSRSRHSSRREVYSLHRDAIYLHPEHESDRHRAGV